MKLPESDESRSSDVTFSVIIPTYNRRDFLVRAVRSVLAQDLATIEVIVVDDGGADDSGEAIQALQDGRVQYFWVPNGERGRARNFGVGKAKGDYVVFLDSDDWMSETHLSDLHRRILLAPERVVLFSYGHLVRDQEGEVVGRFSPPEEVLDHRPLLSGNPYACNFGFLRSESSVTRFAEDRNISSAEDWLFLLVNASKMPLHVFAMTSVSMTQHDGQSMNQHRAVITARMHAMIEGLSSVSLTWGERLLLLGRSLELCSVHCYLASSRSSSLLLCLASGLCLGPRLSLWLLFSKCLLGRRAIVAMKGFFTRS